MNVYDNNFSFIREIPVTKGYFVPRMFDYVSEDMQVAIFEDTIQFLKHNTVFSYSIGDLFKGERRTQLFIPPVLFFYGKDGSIASVVNPDRPEAEIKKDFRNTEATRAMFRDRDPILPKELVLDDKDRLFLDGELHVRYYELFWNYWSEIYPKYGWRPEHRYQTLGGDLNLIGRDGDGNWYWYDYTGEVIIFSSSGFVIDLFEIDREKCKTIPTVNDAGDLFFLSYDHTLEPSEESKTGFKETYGPNVYIWRIPRQWGFEKATPPEGLVTGENLRVRKGPSTDAAVLSVLKESERVGIVGYGPLETIGDTRAPWYKVRTSAGLVGWAWGGFIKVDE